MKHKTLASNIFIIAFNEIGESGISAFSNAICENESLVTLGLRDNGGMYPFSIQTPIDVQYTNQYFVEIAQNAFQHLLRSLSRNSVVKSLSFPHRKGKFRLSSILSVQFSHLIF